MAPPPGLNCPSCNNWLVPRLTKGGLAPMSGSARIRPTTPSTSDTAPNFLRLSPLPLNLLSQHLAGPVRLPTQRVVAYGSSRGEQCKSTRVHGGCSQKKYRKHCQLTGVCNLPAHRSSLAATAPSAALPPPPVHHSAPDAWGLGFNDLFKNVDRPLRVLNEYQRQDDARNAEAGRLLEGLAALAAQQTRRTRCAGIALRITKIKAPLHQGAYCYIPTPEFATIGEKEILATETP
ncbi:hypothetical protein C8F04DRAFT_1247912 [Mycena alexandri]|uniref:Uncharacterized protein n=1 Tax=Mycena alexandri TaxID=1745969 RepID=A0AAD6TJR6_9AGAR|nr:hypothetical protein C8F04DRAFT_1247912 [Mycena alexandri]